MFVMDGIGRIKSTAFMPKKDSPLLSAMLKRIVNESVTFIRIKQ